MERVALPKVIAGCCGLAAFAIAVVAGLAADNPVDTILTRAMMGMILAWIIGGAVGMAAETAVNDALRSYKQANPLPDASAALAGPTQASQQGGELSKPETSA